MCFLDSKQWLPMILSLLLRKSFLLLHQSWTILIFRGDSHAPTARLWPKLIPPKQRCRLHCQEGGIMCSHVWLNQTTMVGHRGTDRFVHTRASWRLFLAPLGPFKEELGDMLHPLPTRTSKMRIECSHFSQKGMESTSTTRFQKTASSPWSRT